jgi:hypothetical protein
LFDGFGKIEAEAGLVFAGQHDFEIFGRFLDLRVWSGLVLPRFPQTMQTVLAVSTIVKYRVYTVFEMPGERSQEVYL